MPKKQRVAKVCSASVCRLRLGWILQLPKLRDLTTHCLNQGQTEPEAAAATPVAEPAAPAVKEAASAAAAAPQVCRESSFYLKHRKGQKHAHYIRCPARASIARAPWHVLAAPVVQNPSHSSYAASSVQEAPVEPPQAAPAAQTEQKITPAQLRAVIASGQQLDLPGFTPCACPHVLLGAR